MHEWQIGLNGQAAGGRSALLAPFFFFFYSTTPADKQLWQPQPTGVHCDSTNQPLDIQHANFLFSRYALIVLGKKWKQNNQSINQFFHHLAESVSMTLDRHCHPIGHNLQT